MSTLKSSLVGNEHMKEPINGNEKMDFNGQMVVPTENSEIDNHGRNMGRKKEKKEKDRLDMEKRESEKQPLQESVIENGATNEKTEWQQPFSNPAEMIYKAVDLNNKIHSTKDSIIARLRKALEDKDHENEKLKEEMAKLEETSSTMLSMPSNVWDRQVILMGELMKSMEIAGKERVEREKTIKYLQTGIQEREGIIILLAEELSLAKGAIFQHLMKMEKIRTATFDAAVRFLKIAEISISHLCPLH